MRILCIILLAIVFISAVADSLFIIAVWVINKIDKEERKEYEKRDI